MNNLWSAAGFAPIELPALALALPPFFGHIVIAVLQIGILIGFVMVTTLLINTIWSYKGKPYTYEQYKDLNWDWRKQFKYSVEQIKQLQQDDLSMIKESISNCEKIKALLETADEDLDDNGDIICDIDKKVQEFWIGNNSGPSGESEFSLPPEIQKANLARRQERAKKRWTATRKNYATVYNKDPIYECFADDDTAASPEASQDNDPATRQKLIDDLLPVAQDYLDKVQDPYQELKAQIEELNKQVNLAADGMLKKFKGLKTAYDHNQKLITEGIMTIAVESKKEESKKEGFVDVFDLQTQVSTLHEQVITAVTTVNGISTTAMDFVQQNLQFKSAVARQVDLSEQILSKTKDLKKGKVTNNDINENTAKHKEKNKDDNKQYPTVP